MDFFLRLNRILNCDYNTPPCVAFRHAIEKALDESIAWYLQLQHPSFLAVGNSNNNNINNLEKKEEKWRFLVNNQVFIFVFIFSPIVTFTKGRIVELYIDRFTRLDV